LGRFGFIVVAVGLALAGCGSRQTDTPAAGPTTAAPASTAVQSTPPQKAVAPPATTVAPAAPPTTAAQAPTTAPPPPTTAAPAAKGTTLVPMQTATGGEFLSPSGNISCEVDVGRAGLTSAYCQTGTPPQSVKMDPTGSYTTCIGDQCLGNPDSEAPTLAYRTATGVGPFRCESATTGVTCTAGGRGFQISTSGIKAAVG